MAVDHLVNRKLNTIVIVWSGETRTHSKDTFDSICRIYSPHYRIIHVGHTWDHCENPSSIGNFTHFHKTNQSEMVNLMKQDPLHFPKLRPDQKSLPAYTWNTPDEYVKVHGEIFKMIWGQVWSHLAAMQLCKKLDNRHNIVGYVRMRWDVESPLFSDNMKTFIEQADNINFYPHSAYKWAEKLGVDGVQEYYDTVMTRVSEKIKEYANDGRDYIITDDRTVHESTGLGWGSLWINDIHWIQVNSMSRKKDRVLKETIEHYPTPEKLISDMLGLDEYQAMGKNCFPDHHPSAHTLWGCVFDYMNFDPYVLLPDELCLIKRKSHVNPKNPFGV